MSLVKHRLMGWLRLLAVCAFAGFAAVPVAAAADATPPSGTIVINGGAATAASRSVTLTLDATDDESGVTDMSFSADAITWTAPEPYATSRPYVLPPGNGPKTVWVSYTDAAGNASEPLSASIILAVPPAVLPGLHEAKAPDPLTVRRVSSATMSLAGYVTDPAYDCVRLATTLGDVRLRLSPSQAPLTVANFLRYVRDGRYDGTFFHRAETGFVVQGGGYLPDPGGGIQAVASYGPVQNEFGLSNTRGTIAMAKVPGNPDSATSEWFFNLADNAANLDYQNGGFTVFGEVLSPGMDIVDAIAALPRADLGGSFSDLPVLQLGEEVLFTDLIYIGAATVEPDELAFAVISSPAGVTADIDGGQLRCTADADAPLAGGSLLLSVTAFDGRAVTLTIPIAVEEADTTAPTGTVLINGGAATTDDPNVTLTLDASDDASGVVALRLSTDSTTWGDWQAYTVSLDVTLPAGMGVNTIYVQFKDEAGNVSASASASITIPGPVTGALVINGGAETTVSRSVTLTLAAVSIADSMYAMRFSYDGTNWLDWEYYSTSRPFVLTPGNGLRTVWVRYADAQWNESLPVSATITLTESPVVLPLPRQLKAVAAIVLYPGGKTELKLVDYVDDPAYERVLVKTSLGDVPLRLFTAQTPLTAANFLRYVDAKRYDGTFFHRSVPGFIVQGGGYSLDSGGTVQEVPSYGPVANEFGVSSTRGRIAMAKVGNDPNSATCEWFFNLADNSANLDYQNGGFTVFGEVLDMTAVDAIAVLPRANAGDPFTDLPLKNFDGVNIYLADFISLTAATRQPDELTFSVTGSVPGLNASVTGDGRLVIQPGANPVLTSGTFTLHAGTPDGRVLDLPIPVSVVPTPVIATLTFNRFTKGDPGTLRVVLNVVGTNTPTQWSATGGVAPTGWIDVTGYTTDPITPTRLSFPIQIPVLTTAGARSLAVTLRNGNGLASALKTVSVTVPAVTVSTASVKSVAGLTATLNVKATSTADEYAVMDGPWDAASAVWQPITGGTISSGNVTFSPTCALKPLTGTHTVNVAVRRTDLGLVSSPRAATTTLTGPGVYAFVASKISGATATLAITVTGSPTEYAVMEGVWNAGAAVWKTISAGTIVSGRLNFAASFVMAPTVGAHILYVAVRDPVTGLTSATKTLTVSLVAPVLAALSSTGVAGTVVTLSIGVTGSPDQFAVMEGAWNAPAADWQTIPPGTTSRGRLTFTAPFALQSFAGAHTVSVAVRNSALNAISASRSVSVTVAAPAITSLTPASGGAGRTVVTLTGTAFGPSSGASGKVEFGAVSGTIQAWTNTQIKCVVPQAVALGAVNVIVTTSAGLVSAPRVFTVLPFWLGAWTGTFQDTADSEAGGGPLKHGWMILTAATTAAPNGISLRLASGETLTGTLNPADDTFTVAGTKTDGTALTLSGTLLFGALTGTLTWLEPGPGGTSGTSDYALAFPNTAKATLSGTYVGSTEDQFDSRAFPLINKKMLLTASQSGQTITLTDAVFGTRLTGTLTGDVFVAVGTTGLTVYGHVTATDAAGIVQAFDATYAWSDSAGWGWGELVGGRSTGVIGVPAGTTAWTLTKVSSFGGNVPLGTVIAISSRGNRITVTTTDPALVRRALVGKIFRNPDGVGSTFIAKDTLFTLYGVLNGTAIAGSYEDETPSDFDNGICTGTNP